MGLETRSTDAKGRVCLPKAFANATVIIEQVSDHELRIRKARVIPEDEVRFSKKLPSFSRKGNASGSCKHSIVRPSRTPRCGA